MNYTARKISLLLLLFLSIAFIPIGQSIAIDIDVMDSEFEFCHGCEGSTEQAKDHCIDKDCALGGCISSCSVAFYFDPSTLAFSLVRVKTLSYGNLLKFQSQITAPNYRPPIA